MAPLFPLPSHSTTIFVAEMSRTGFIVSSIVNVADAVVVFPQSSVAVNVTEAEPVAPHSSESSL